MSDHPEDANAHHSLGYVYWKEKHYDEAVERLQKAVSLKEDFANAHFNLARTYIDVGRYDEAVAKLPEVRTLNPALTMLRQVENQLVIVRNLRKLQYETSSAALALAEAYLRDGDLVRATRATRRAAEQSESDPGIHLRLAGLYESLELVDRALETYEKLATLNPGDGQIQKKVAQFRLLQKDRVARQRWLSSSEIVFEEERKDDGHPETCHAALQAWSDYDFDGSIEAGRLREAASLYEQTIAEQRDHMHAYSDLAMIYELLGEYAHAASIWRRGLQVSPGNPAAEAAIRRLELMGNLDLGGLDTRREAEILEEIGKLHHLGGEFERALEYFARAAKRTPDDDVLWLSMAASHEGAGAYGDAIGAYERALALELDPTRAASIAQRLGKLRALMPASGGLETGPTD